MSNHQKPSEIIKNYQFSNSNDQGRLYELLQRIHALMERYFDAIENSLVHKDYPFEHRERDARVFSALARTLEKLTQVERLITEPARSKEQDDTDIYDRLEQRLARLIDGPAKNDISEKSQL